ncbi:DUF3662 and FHA domain-containing protein [Corynebacterium sp. TAE3-ERU12]|uniref:DUF3662 and FHA domain-containing protein n=1 Tax=Corynebacterium sp. TAE3-ERU12 TaxID=2849491 RepID=UPI001C458DDE|nr:DUF3662 and FHA domain-containing protein [Corynebacterium sp. TAE3-ERU12]MBV7294368.1 DUF3662 and FHA domain-containing protein [Corynebacterium sp. TAE3-ERU12]
MDFLGRIRKLDSTLQRGLDNGFARVFGGKVVPNELEECLKQEIEDFLMQDANGRFLAPNDFRIGVSPTDFDHLSTEEHSLPQNLADRMSRYCRNNGWSLSGSVAVRIELVPSLHTGQLKTASQFLEGKRDNSGYVGETTSAQREADTGPEKAATPAAEEHNPDTRGTSSVVAPGPEAESPTEHAPAGTAGVAGASAASAASAAAGSAPASVDRSNRAWADADFAEPATTVTGEPGAPDAPAAAPPSESTHTVVLYLQDGSNRTFEVSAGSNILGRGTASDFRLPDTGVSRQHAEITWDGRDAILVDLHSTNGTLVNDTPVDNWLLADGDIISMGHSVMEVRFT